MIKVSDITAYHTCPRMCYFLGKGHDLIKDISPEYIERMILKELALNYGSVYQADDKLSILNEELARISNEIPVIYRKELAGIDEKVIEGAFAKVRSCLEDISHNISSSGDLYACGLFQVEPVLRSEKFGITGSPDKLMNMNESYVPSIIKTGKMPENGIWQSDRLQLTAYAILVEEEFNIPVERGYVEYARFGKVREGMIKRNDRRMVLQIRDRIQKIHEGFMPERPKDAPCMNCGFDEICDVRSSLASRFF